MSIEELVVEKLRELPLDRKKEVLDFVESLREKKGANQPLKSLYGLWADLGVEISEKDIADARREMWGTFPAGVLLVAAVLDTHAAVWYLLKSLNLSSNALHAIECAQQSGEPVFVPRSSPRGDRLPCRKMPPSMAALDRLMMAFDTLSTALRVRPKTG